MLVPFVKTVARRKDDYCADLQVSFSLFWGEAKTPPKKMLRRDMNFWAKTNVKFQEQPETGALLLNGKALVLPYKPHAVLKAIVKAAPGTISREHLIETIWDSNFLVGDKALSQALWQIRSYLDAHHDCGALIKTIPRHGYQWTGPHLQQPTKFSFLKYSQFTRTAITVLSAVFALIIVHVDRVSVEFGPPSYSSQATANTSTEISAATGTSASISAKQLLVRHAEGCVFNILAAPETVFKNAAFSDDGKKIAVNVIRSGVCTIEILEFKTRKFEKFAACAAT